MRVWEKPNVVGALKRVRKGLERNQEELMIRMRIETVQAATLFLVGYDTQMSPRDLRRLAATQTP